MLILKGDNGKSRVLDIIMNKTNSVCFVYNNYPIICDAICVDSRKYSLEDFLKCISEDMLTVINDKYYEYLLIYTNQNEEDLKGIIDWINKHKYEIKCINVIITCK